MLLDQAVAPPTRIGLALRGATFSVLLLLAGVAVQTRQAVATQVVQTFGPGKVSCQAMIGTGVDCLLAANRVTPDNRNVATFSLTALPPDERALFRRWCLAATSKCTATITGRRDSPESSRLSTVASIHWTRPSPPVNNSAARMVTKKSRTDTAEPAIRPAR